MSYVATAKLLRDRFAWWKRIDGKLARIIPAVGVHKVPAGLPPGERARRIGEQVAVCRQQGARGIVLFHLLAVKEETARILGKAVFVGKAKPYAPG